MTIAFFILVLYIIDKFRQEETFKPDFCNYTEGKFKRWKWSWEREYNYSQKAWVITKMKAHCPKCNTPMIEYLRELRFDCPRCDFIAMYECDDPIKIERIILDNIDRIKKETKKQPNIE